MRRAVLAAGLAAATTVAGCQSAPLYRPAAAPGASGYFDQPISERRVQVTFRGTAVTPRETVESALLVRAAEVAEQRGFSHFVFDTRDTAADLRIRSDFSPWPGWGWPGYGWYYHGWGSGWGAGLRTEADTIGWWWLIGGFSPTPCQHAPLNRRASALRRAPLLL